MKFHFDCTFCYVTDLDRSIRFYTQVLGFQFLSRDAVARFDVDGVLFELVPTAARSERAGQGHARLCLRVDDMAEALRYLRAQGVPVHGVEDKQTGVLAACYDPDENEICLWQYRS
jgi:catechol 2,3-dioxygenase-like lactoylglutathione lyase family enzyme